MEKGTKIFLVDDDEFLLDMYALKFKEAGFDVDLAASGDEALDKLRKIL
jgi:DNA-binding response OmpR family regulator